MGEIQELNIPKKRLDPIGLQMYGAEDFTGFQKLAEYVDLIGPFKDWYYEKKIIDKNLALRTILQEFNEKYCKPLQRKFHPSGSQLRLWRKKWDLDLMQQMTEKSLVVPDSKKSIKQVLKTRGEDGEIVLGGTDMNQLEAGVQSLGGELVNDAIQMLRDDQALEEVYTSDEIIKRRQYITNVFAHVTRLVHGKAALVLKASEEKRNTAGFLMNILAKATAGKMTDEEMAVLKTSYVAPPVVMAPTPVDVTP